MSQQKKLDLSERVREFRGRSKLSQQELAERLGVSGNYLSMIELGKKTPGPSLRKLFESFEQSPLYASPGGATGELKESFASASRAAAGNPLPAMLSTETLLGSIADVAGRLAAVGELEQKQAIGNLREWLDELERRLLAGSGGLSEAQRIAVRAAKSARNQGAK